MLGGVNRYQWINVVRNREISKLTHTGGPRKVAQINPDTGKVTVGGYKWEYIDD